MKQDLGKRYAFFTSGTRFFKVQKKQVPPGYPVDNQSVNFQKSPKKGRYAFSVYILFYISSLSLL